MNRTWIAALSVAVATAALAGCSSGNKPAATASATASDGITITDARMNLPAVSGNPGALYFTVKNDGDMGTVIRSVKIDGVGSTQLHETATWNGKPDMQQVTQILVPAHGEMKLQPEKYHVMAMTISDSLKAGGETKATATFAGGDTVTFPVKILAPGKED